MATQAEQMHSLRPVSGVSTIVFTGWKEVAWRVDFSLQLQVATIAQRVAQYRQSARRDRVLRFSARVLLLS